MARRRCLMLVVALVALAGGLFAGCGEAGDDPEDCRPGEFFNEADDSCEPCPAIRDPECLEGCGFSVVEDDRGCPQVECADICLCDEGEFFSEETFDCEDCEEANDPPAICFEPEDEDEDD